MIAVPTMGGGSGAFGEEGGSRMEKQGHDGKAVTRMPGIGYIGLGKMGFNMVGRLLEKGYRVTVFDTNEHAVEDTARLGAEPAVSIEGLAGRLEPPRLLWLMVPHNVVDGVLEALIPSLASGDIVVDGGNSYYKDSMRRAGDLAKKGIEFLDVGVSGGPAGARSGACIMAGGKKEVFERHEQLFLDLAVPHGYGYMGNHGAGHFVKMVHNGIEYGMMQALAEGFSLMKFSPFKLTLTKVAGLYDHGSVITSRLTGWLRKAFEEYGEDLDVISGSVAQSGEGMWTVEAGREYGVRTPIFEGAVDFRTASSAHPSYAGQVIAALRNQFGKHDVFRK